MPALDSRTTFVAPSPCRTHPSRPAQGSLSAAAVPRSAATCSAVKIALFRSPTTPVATATVRSVRPVPPSARLEARQAEAAGGLYHVVFTLGHQRYLPYHNKAVIYRLLFQAAAETLLTIAGSQTPRRNRGNRRPPYLGLGLNPPPAALHRARRRLVPWFPLGGL